MTITDKRTILKQVESYYNEKLHTFGPTYKGVDWNSLESQELRFTQLLKVCNINSKFSLLEYGCGYGAMFEFLLKKNLDFHYTGFDISQQMADAALKLYGTYRNFRVKAGESPLETADYCVASGLFNVRLKNDISVWEAYILSIIHDMDQHSKKGFAFNCLTSYSDSEFTKEYLYYGNPCFFFDYCKLHYSHKVALLHDYGLYEFTILVRKE